ncbi:MAG: hypothetical protein CML24_10710 [Rhizobiales bacterium]|nr:hypothetical protein [Hyphomicrobiales bacterium]
MIALGARGAAELMGMSRSTASRSFVELQEHGFIAVAEGYSFHQKRRVNEWRLTELKCDRTGAIPSHDYRNWQPAPVDETVSVPVAAVPDEPTTQPSHIPAFEGAAERQGVEEGQQEVEQHKQFQALEAGKDEADPANVASHDASDTGDVADREVLAAISSSEAVPTASVDATDWDDGPHRSLDDPWWEDIPSAFELRPTEFLEDWDVLLEREYAALPG